GGPKARRSSLVPNRSSMALSADSPKTMHSMKAMTPISRAMKSFMRAPLCSKGHRPEPMRRKTAFCLLVARITQVNGRNEHARRGRAMRGDGGDIHHDVADPGEGDAVEGGVSDLLVRVASVVGEIEALKRER